MTTFRGWFLAIVGIICQALLAAAIMASVGGGSMGAFLGYLVICAILWAIVAAVAKAKNRSVSMWLLWTFCFGVFALLFLIFKPRAKVMPGKTKLCPHCQSEIPEQATVCRYCTRDIVPVATLGAGEP